VSYFFFGLTFVFINPWHPVLYHSFSYLVPFCWPPLLMLLWYFYGISEGFLWNSYGISIRIPVGSLYSFYGISRVFLLDFNGISMEFQ
jgi:hypothetical protein